MKVIGFLNSFDTGLVYSPEDSSKAQFHQCLVIDLYTYAYNAKGYSSLTNGSDLTSLKASIQKITYDNTADRNLFAALNKEEAEVTPNSGFRTEYSHILVLISGDSWTGTSVIGSSVLKSVQQKYDMIMAIGVGPNAVVNQGSVLPQFTGTPSTVFFSANYDQLTYVAQWMYNYACPSGKLPTQAPTTTIMPTQSPSVPCTLNSLNYDVYLVVDTSTANSASDFAALKQTLYDFVKVFLVGNGKTQFAIVATSIDSELYFTSFHQAQDRATILNTIQTLTQDGSAGQSLLLSLQAIQSAYLSKNYVTANKLLVYFTGTTVWDQDPTAQMKSENTNWDQDPTAQMKSENTKYGLKPLALKQTLYDFVKVFLVGNGKTQFAIVATSIDSELYFTSFHQAQDRATILNTIQTLTQDGSAGQSLLLSLQAIQSAYLSKNYVTANKLLVYFTGTTVWDQDPTAQMKSENTKYGLKPLAVQWNAGASISSLTSFTGGSNCVFSATSPTTRAAAATWVQTAMCKKTFCM